MSSSMNVRSSRSGQILNASWRAVTKVLADLCGEVEHVTAQSVSRYSFEESPRRNPSATTSLGHGHELEPATRSDSRVAGRVGLGRGAVMRTSGCGPWGFLQ